jgi:hypothetical protein
MLDEKYAIVTEEELLRKVTDTENNFNGMASVSSQEHPLGFPAANN